MTNNDVRLTETEISCGVTAEDALATASRARVIGDDTVVMPEGTAPAVATAAARHLIGRPVIFEGLNGYGFPLYRARGHGEWA